MAMSDLVLLRAIAARPGETGIRPLAAELGASSPAVMRKVGRLIDLGLVDEAGERTAGVLRRLKTTPKGRAVLSETSAFFAAAAEPRP
jgi:DNA-binding MarR family transcriptional regulator